MFTPKLGASLVTISSDLTDELFAALADSALATVEVSAALDGQGDPETTRQTLRAGLARCRVAPASVHALFGGGYDFSVLDESLFNQAVEHGLKGLQLAADLGAPRVVVHASAEPVEVAERSARLAQASRGLGRLGAWAADHGVRIAVEVLPRTCLGNTITELLDLLEGLDDEVFGVCLDTNHLMDRYQTLPAEIHRLGNRLLATHLSDYDGVDEKHDLPGNGVVDWSGVMKALEAIDYQGPLNYECALPGDTPRERLTALENNFAWLAGLAGGG